MPSFSAIFPAKKIAFLSLLGISLIGCEADEETNTPAPISSLRFAQAQQSVAEDAAAANISVALDRAAAQQGFVRVKLQSQAVYGTHYRTMPEAINGYVLLTLPKGGQIATFSIQPIDNEAVVGDLQIGMTLENPSEGFQLITANAQSQLTIVEDDVPVSNDDHVISFTENFVHLTETDVQGFEVGVNVTPNISGIEHIKIHLQVPSGFQYGRDFYTEPEAVLDTIRMPIFSQNSANKLKVIPVNDVALQGTFEVVFTMVETGNLEKGQQASFTLKIEEDEPINATVHAISEVLEMFNRSDNWYFPQDYYIEGVITSDKNVWDNKTVFIQDASGAIAIQTIQEEKFEYGDKVRINLKGGERAMVNGTRVIRNVFDRMGIVVATNQYLAPEVITVKQLLSGLYAGKRVQIKDVQFVAANGSNTFKGVQGIRDESYPHTAVAQFYVGTTFDDQVIPAHEVTLTGIVGEWGDRILPQRFPNDLWIFPNP